MVRGVIDARFMPQVLGLSYKFLYQRKFCMASQNISMAQL